MRPPIRLSRPGLPWPSSRSISSSGFRVAVDEHAEHVDGRDRDRSLDQRVGLVVEVAVAHGAPGSGGVGVDAMSLGGFDLLARLASALGDPRLADALQRVGDVAEDLGDLLLAAGDRGGEVAGEDAAVDLPDLAQQLVALLGDDQLGGAAVAGDLAAADDAAADHPVEQSAEAGGGDLDAGGERRLLHPSRPRSPRSV